MLRKLVYPTIAAVAFAACGQEITEPTDPGLESSLQAARGADVNRSSPLAVYTITNQVSANEVAVFARSTDGTLTPAGTFSTGGLGTGGGLGNQGSVILTRNRSHLYVVNAGSNDISAFNVTRDGIELIGAPIPSGGEQPVSLTVHRHLLYVLNAGSGNIAGFRVRRDGSLTPIPGSSRPVSATEAGAAQIQFSPNGRVLVVTERVTNTISTYVVESDGTASGPHAQPSAGETPFGFGFNLRGVMIVSEAAGGAADASSASSYRLDRQGNLTLISGPVATTQTAACWVAISPNGKFAYTTNTGSGTVSSLRIGRGGTLLLSEAVAGVTGPDSRPLDAAFTPGGRFLYVRNGAGNISAFRFGKGGSLTHIGDFGSLPAGANGIAVG